MKRSNSLRLELAAGRLPAATRPALSQLAKIRTAHVICLVALGVIAFGDCSAAGEIGVFSEATDVGQVARGGSTTFAPDQQSYTVSGGGENMWAGTDAFHFVWRQISGNVSLAANAQWLTPGGNAHRKACLIIRQSLAPDSAYADAAVHGDGLCSLQYRETAGGPTREIQSALTNPARFRIEKQGDVLSMSVALADQPLESAGGSFRLHFTEPFYVGLGVCAHDNRVRESAVFSKVELRTGTVPLATNAVVESTLETVAIASKDRRVIYHSQGLIEAPNWSRDGQSFVFNRKGHMYRLARNAKDPQIIDTGFANRCNNDHGLSPDGSELVISHHGDGGRSRIYLLPSGGGTPRLVTNLGPSYWHGWSPDGKTLVYCGERGDNFDIYSIPASGGAEFRLTSSPGLDDGPDFSPDGQWIYFNSERSGHMQIWRMKPDGSQPEQVLADETNDWFPHPSPDGKWLVFLSYAPDVTGHPANKDVFLRIRPLAGGESQVLATLFGGQGTINVSSWSPDSKQLAFVSYRLVNP